MTSGWPMKLIGDPYLGCREQSRAVFYSAVYLVQYGFGIAVHGGGVHQGAVAGGEGPHYLGQRGQVALIVAHVEGAR